MIPLVIVIKHGVVSESFTCTSENCEETFIAQCKKECDSWSKLSEEEINSVLDNGHYTPVVNAQFTEDVVICLHHIDAPAQSEEVCASIKFVAEDVQSVNADISIEDAEKFMKKYHVKIQDHLGTEGHAVIDELLSWDSIEESLSAPFVKRD